MPAPTAGMSHVGFACRHAPGHGQLPAGCGPSQVTPNVLKTRACVAACTRIQYAPCCRSEKPCCARLTRNTAPFLHGREGSES
eukprot:352386-Chlamydomonas_euryale.AAC.3